MDDKRAEEIAVTFLRQNYSVIRIEKSKLVNKIWVVEVLVSSFDNQAMKKVMIENKTGSIVKVE
ncbi:MAG TPA: hypothetical protein VFA69_02040 [Candidatus Nitrosotalea sp.]|nr:hypothetical protein [Candidatus Nitrosotalea sp.]